MPSVALTPAKEFFSRLEPAPFSLLPPIGNATRSIRSSYSIKPLKTCCYYLSGMETDADVGLYSFIPWNLHPSDCAGIQTVTRRQKPSMVAILLLSWITRNLTVQPGIKDKSLGSTPCLPLRKTAEPRAVSVFANRGSDLALSGPREAEPHNPTNVLSKVFHICTDAGSITIRLHINSTCWYVFVGLCAIQPDCLVAKPGRLSSPSGRTRALKRSPLNGSELDGS